MPPTVASAQPMITLEHVTKRYPNGHLAVDDLSLEVAAGEIAVLVGPSGCGKTTTMKMINRLIEPTSGRILLDGENIVEADPVVKGQTAASSYKPAKLENGVRVMVPPFVEAGERIVVDTNEVTYVKRAE